MRSVQLYLTGYVLLVLGALAALWTGGVLQRLPATWVLIALVMAVGLGVMLAVTAGRPAVTRD